MSKSEAPTIVGAGLAGLIAAHAWPRSTVFEAAAGPSAAHKALLRFRGESVASLTGIEFERVTVRKGIWYDGAFIQPNIFAANCYAQKVLGHYALAASERSIWSIDPVERYIAPDDFYERLIESVGSRIEWGNTYDLSESKRQPVVSTMPLPVALRQLGIEMPQDSFAYSRIGVHRWRLPRTKLFQTIYFPALDVPVYRASITGSTLIVECFRETPAFEALAISFSAFGILPSIAGEVIDHLHVEQKYGKIIELPAAIRRPLLHDLSVRHNVYSLGRFATYRNILLDDVVQDIAVIRRLMRGDAYTQRLASFNRKEM